MSPALVAALAVWLAWVERGAPEGEPYSRDYPLCHCFGYSSDASKELRGILLDQLGDGHWPWGSDRHGMAHANPSRLAWVRKILAEHGEAVS